MRSSLSRVLIPLALITLTQGCAAPGGAGVELGGDTGGRYLVMIPDLEGPGGDRVADELRALVTEMPTHAAINEREIRRSMAEYDLPSLDEITARQLAQVVSAQLVSWGTIRQTGASLVADVKFVDTRSGDEIVLDDVTAGTPQELAGEIFDRFQRSVEGIRQAVFCNDYLSSEQYRQALETCDTALAIVPSSTTALYGRATSLLYLEREAEALETYDRLLDVDPTHQDALLGAGLAASRLDRSTEAMRYYNRYLELNPQNVQVRITVANDVAQTGDYVSAYRILDAAVDENQDNVDFQRYLFSIATAAGQRTMEMGDTTEAREIFGTALSAYDRGFATGEPPLPSQIRQAIAVNNALGRTDEAIRIARDATERFPDDPQIWSQLATVLTQAESHDEALEALNRVVALDPEYENAYLRRAQVYFALDRRRDALADLERAASGGNRETVAQVLFTVAVEEIRAERWADAVALLTPAQEYAGANLRSDVAFYRGFAIYKQGETIARANQNGDAEPAGRALTFFRQALPVLEQSRHAQAPQVIESARQYIDNQEAILRAARAG